MHGSTCGTLAQRVVRRVDDVRANGFSSAQNQSCALRATIQIATYNARNNVRFASLPSYGLLKGTVGLRLDAEEEFNGADLSIHKINATPEI